MKRKIFRWVAIIVLCFFSWSFLGIYDLAYAIERHLHQPSHNSKRSEASRPEERFQKAIEEIEEILEDPTAERETKARRVKVKRTEIEELDRGIRKQFAETEKKLREASLPEEILERHHKFVKYYEDNLNELKTNLETIEKTKGLAVEIEIEKAKKHLQRVKQPKKHTPLDPNKLPHRTPDVKKKAPRLKKEDFERDFPKPKKAQRQNKPILVASVGSLKGLLSPNDEQGTMNYEPNTPLMVAQATNQPTTDDLAENIEVQFTPEIRAKAQELGYNPVRIYNWVHNNIEFVPTYGSIQGAHMTLLTKQGNAFDTASLLIALLRASNIPARYVYGTIELPIDKVMNWVGGFTDPTSAIDLIASGGIPGVAVTSGGKITGVRMEHMWVEAYVPYGNYRGAMRDISVKTWIPMDGSFKQYTYKEPINFPSVVGFDLQAFIDEVQSLITVDTSTSSISNVPQSLILQRVQEYIQSVHQYYDTNLQNKNVEDVLGAKRVIAQEYSYLLGSLPYRAIVIGNRYSQLPDSLRWRINFKVVSDLFSSEPDFSYTAPTAFLATKSITVSYKPSAIYDESLVQTYGCIEKVPPYLLNLTPELIISGEAVASGIPVGSGKNIDLIMTFISPSGSQDMISNKETVGAYLGIGLELSWVSKPLLDQKLAEINQANSSPNRKLQEYLSFLALVYFAELDANNYVEAIFAKIINIRHPSIAIIGPDFKVSYFWGIPQAISFVGMFIDVDRDIHSVGAKDGDKNRVMAFNISSGYNGSSMEHALWEQIYNLPGISAVKVHQLSNEMGIPIHEINKSNITSILSLLQISSEAKSNITSAVSAGKIVLVPQRNIQHFDWIGTAYIMIDPETGTGGYIISGGLAGGSSALSWEDCFYAVVQILDIFPFWDFTTSVIIDYFAYMGAKRDISKSSASDLNKEIASALAFYGFVAGIIGSFPLTLKLKGIIMVIEIICYVGIFYLLKGELPVIHKDPLEDCWKLIRK